MFTARYGLIPYIKGITFRLLKVNKTAVRQPVNIRWLQSNPLEEARGGQLAETLRYKPEGCGFDSRWFHWNFSLKQSFRPHYGPRTDLASNRNECQEYFLGVKAAGVYSSQPCHLHVPIVLKSGRLNLLEPSGPVQACNGTALPFTLQRLPVTWIIKIQFVPHCKHYLGYKDRSDKCGIGTNRCLYGDTYKHANALCEQKVALLGKLAKLRKETISFLMPVRPSVWNNSDSTGRTFMKFDIWVFFENLERKFKFS